MTHNIFGGGSNLPPGCRVSDIPGNSSEEGLAEAREIAFYENNTTKEEWALIEKLNTKTKNDFLLNLISKAIEFGIDCGYRQSTESSEEGRSYEIRYLEETIEQNSPEEAIPKIKKMFNIK